MQGHKFRRKNFQKIAQTIAEKSQRFLRKLEKAAAVQKSLLERFSGKFRRCWKILARVWAPFWQREWRLVENRPRLREHCWILSSETATAFLSLSEFLGGRTKIVAFRRAPPCAAKTRAARPVFVRVVGELWAANPSKRPSAHEAKG